MKRAIIISAAAHLTILIVLWQVSLTLSRPVTRGYPRLMTAKLVVKPAAVTSRQATPEPAAAVEATPKPEPPPEPVAETQQPAKVVVPAKPEKKTPPAPKPSVPTSSGTAGNSTKSANAGGSGASGGGNVMKIDAEEFPFPYYLVQVQNKIEQQWHAPSRQEQRATTVYFKISRSGEVEDVKIEQSSGNALFDQAAMRAVYYASPLPPLPAGSGLQSLGVHFDFVAY
ncbi:TonB family protein [candidate division KSB1 bacterium]|nr:TonB family protein [candidate division KSB1 bacterium]